MSKCYDRAVDKKRRSYLGWPLVLRDPAVPEAVGTKTAARKASEKMVNLRTLCYMRFQGT